MSPEHRQAAGGDEQDTGVDEPNVLESNVLESKVHESQVHEPDGDAVAEHRRRILLSVVAGLIALAGLAIPMIVLAGGRTSSASFADSEVFSANRLGAAVLDIEVEAAPSGSGADGGVVDRHEGLFSATNLAPGDRISGQLAMTNAGDLPLRYGLSAIGEGGRLGQWLRFEVWAGTGTCAPDQPAPRVIDDVQIGSTPVPLVDLVRDDSANVLRPGDSFLWCIGALLPLDTPNAAQGQSLDLTLLVTAEHLIEEGP